MKIDFDKGVIGDVPKVEIIAKEIPVSRTEEYQHLVEDSIIESKNGSRKINDGLFAKAYAQIENIVYVNGLFYSPTGARSRDEVRRDVHDSLMDLELSTNIAATVDKVVKALECGTYVEKIDMVGEMHLPFKNGDLYVNAEGNWKFIMDDLSPVPYRFPVEFKPFYNEIETPMFNKWLHDLLDDDDIKSLQDYVGYCFLPTTVAQETLLLVGQGGTGKSVIKSVLSAVFGKSMYSVMQMEEVFKDKFKQAELENKLILYDDDLNQSALSDTSIFKKLVTNTGTIKADRKFGQPFDMTPYARIIACCNFMLSAQYDTSDGFFRRLHPIHVKDKVKGRQDIRGFDMKVAAEAEGIAQWALLGLYRVLQNNYHIHTSERSKEYLEGNKRLGTHYEDFIEDCFDFGRGNTTSNVELNKVYAAWCAANGVDERNTRSLSKWMLDKGMNEYSISQSRSVPRGDRSVRGWRGISIKEEWTQGSNQTFKIKL